MVTSTQSSMSAHVRKVDVEVITKACEDMSWNIGYAPKGELKHSAKSLGVILDEGSFGWAPSLYILSENPLDLIDKTHRLIDKYIEVNK